MNARNHSHQRGFTLMETMIALAVMTVLITGFLAVFGPAAGSIRKALTIEEINRLQATLERELSILREGETVSGITNPTAFDKAMNWIANSHEDGADTNIVLLYQYRGNPTGTPRSDGSLPPVSSATGEAGINFVLQPAARRLSDTLLSADLAAIEGRVFFVKTTQLIYDADGALTLGTAGAIHDPAPNGADHTGNSTTYPEAVIAFQADFFILPTISYSYISGSFDPSNFTKPAFSRNMAVRR